MEGNQAIADSVEDVLKAQKPWVGTVAVVLILRPNACPMDDGAIESVRGVLKAEDGLLAVCSEV